MRVRCVFRPRSRCWHVYDVKTERVVGCASRVLLRDVTFRPAGYLLGSLDAAQWQDGGNPIGWTRGDGAYVYFAVRTGLGCVHRGAAVWLLDGTREPITKAEMTYLTRDRARPFVYAFDPGTMTAEESKRTTR